MSVGMQESEKRFSTIFHSSPVGMAITRFADGRYLDVNREFLRLMGYEREEVVGQTSASLQAWVNPEERTAFVAQLQAQQRVVERTAYFRNKKKDVWIARLSAEVIEVDGESVILSLLQDITEKLRAEEAKARLAAIVETAEEAIIGETVEGVITSWNKGAQRLFGYTAEEIVGQSASLLVPPDRISEFTMILELINRGQRIQPFDTERLRKDGTTVEVSAAGSPILDAAGQVVATATIARDVSARRRAEAEVLQLNAELEKRVQERTEALIESNSQLEAAKKAAEQANLAKSSFLATMSHEIRTPMNAVIGFTNLALRTALTTQQKEYLSKIYSAGVSLLALINDILDFSKIEAGRLVIEEIDFFLRTVIDQVTSINGNGAFAKGLEFLVDVSPEIPPSLIGDPNRLNQILTNLVGNAVKFTTEGEIQLNVAVLETTGDKVKLRFEVWDTGVGMTDEQVSKLFQPFAQADASITRKFGGTGLGLSIVRRLVELMGGQIWANSILGSGTTFAFTVWFGVSQKLKDTRPSLPGQADGMKVLVVDDNPSSGVLMSEMMRSLRFRVEGASSGQEAVDAVHRADSGDPFGLVLMDWKMPGIDGTEATRRILSPRWLQHPPQVILLSAFLGSEEGRKQALGAGAAEFLQKPITPSTLLDAVMKIFGPKDEGGAPSEPRAPRKILGARILLVEDNDMNQQIASELLQSEGAQVVIAASGLQAIEELTRAPSLYDIVLMDIQMPDMDGYEATRQIRSREWGQRIPIIAMTAHALEEERQTAFEAGMDDHIGKPIDPEAMFQVIRKYYRGAPAEEAAPAVPLAQLPPIDGVAVADGLRRAGGNERLYLDLLRGFVTRHRSTAADLRQAVTQGNRDAAERISHSVNGLAGNLGLVHVHLAAADLERRIRGQDNLAGLNDGIDALAQAYENAADSIEQALPRGGKTAGVPASRAEAEKIFERLAVMVKNSDGDSQDYFETSFEKLGGWYSAAVLDELRRNLKNYDFDLATASLEKGRNEQLR